EAEEERDHAGHERARQLAAGRDLPGGPEDRRGVGHEEGAHVPGRVFPEDEEDADGARAHDVRVRLQPRHGLGQTAGADRIRLEAARRRPHDGACRRRLRISWRWRANWGRARTSRSIRSVPRGESRTRNSRPGRGVKTSTRSDMTRASSIECVTKITVV